MSIVAGISAGGTTQKLGWKLIAIPTPNSFSQFRGKGLMLPVVFGSHENNSKKFKNNVYT